MKQIQKVLHIDFVNIHEHELFMHTDIATINILICNLGFCLARHGCARRSVQYLLVSSKSRSYSSTVPPCLCRSLQSSS